MHPEMSLIILTVFTTVGQGMFILLVALQAIVPELPRSFFIASGLGTLGFQFIGMGASFFHLANPSRGWKAILMWKNSWLSKEIISLSVFVGLAGLYFVLYIAGVRGTVFHVIGYAGIAASLAFFVASSMVYASITYIKEWANAFTPTGFMLYGLTGGTAFMLALLHMTGSNSEVISGVTMLLIVLTVLSLLLKAMAYHYNSRAYTSLSAKHAIGMNDPNIELIDMGTPYEHFNTKEYYYPFTKEKNKLYKRIVLAIAFVIPLIIWLVVTFGSGEIKAQSFLLTGVGACIMLLGILLERHLFFIQGNHIQNLYYGRFRKCIIENPLLTAGKAG